MAAERQHYGSGGVALLAEGVDRNLRPAVEEHIDEVALLAEGVDRNPLVLSLALLACVALLAEGVDRNNHCRVIHEGELGRPPRGGRG